MCIGGERENLIDTTRKEGVYDRSRGSTITFLSGISALFLDESTGGGGQLNTHTHTHNKKKHIYITTAEHCHANNWCEFIDLRFKKIK